MRPTRETEPQFFDNRILFSGKLWVSADFQAALLRWQRCLPQMGSLNGFVSMEVIEYKEHNGFNFRNFARVWLL